MKKTTKSLPQIFLLSLLFICLSTISAEAAKISKVKGKKVLIRLEGDDADKGDIFIALDKRGKKKGIVRISRVKGSKAIGKLLKGKARKGWKLQSRDEVLSGRSSSRGIGSKSKWSVGALGGFNLNTMNVDINNGGNITSASLSGNSISYKAFIDYQLARSFSLRASLGIDNFEADGEVTDNSCTGSNECTAEISYLAASLMARYKFSRKTTQFWVGGGGTLLNPQSPKSNAIDISSISTTLGMRFGGGVDYQLSKKTMIPLQVTYTLLPKSDDVSANFIAIQLGFGYNF